MLVNILGSNSRYKKIFLFTSISLLLLSGITHVKAETWRVALTDLVTEFFNGEPLAVCEDFYEYWEANSGNPNQTFKDFYLGNCGGSPSPVCFRCRATSVNILNGNEQDHNSLNDAIRVCHAEGEYWVAGTSQCQTCPNTGDAFNATTQTCEPRNIQNEPLTDSNCNPGNPCNVATGEKVDSHVDYDDGWLRFSRHYHSRVHTHEPKMGNFMGNGWTHNFSDHVVIENNTVLGWIRGDGYHEPMAEKENATGQYISNSNSKLDSELISNGNGYTLRRGDSVDTFDANGNLIQREVSGGHTLTLSYNSSSGLLETVTDEAGRSLIFGYVNGLLDTVTTPWDIISYQYDINNNLIEVDFPGIDTIQYHYENSTYPHHLTGITDERGNRSTYTYDARGKTQTTSPVGAVGELTFDYNTHGASEGAQTTVKDYNPTTQSLTDVTEYNFTPGMRHIDSIVEVCQSGDTRCTQDSVVSNYWDGDNLVATDDNGLVIEYGGYDEIGRYHYMIESGKIPGDTSPYSQDARRIDFEYHNTFINKVTKRIEHSVVNSNATTTNVDLSTECVPSVDFCKVTDSTYNSKGNLTQRTVSGYKPDGTPVSRTTTWQYNGPYGQISSINGPRTDLNDVVNFTYYPDLATEGNNRGRLQRVTLANGTIERDNIQYNSRGSVTSETLPNNVTVYYSYELNNNISSIFRSLNGANQTTEILYEINGGSKIRSITVAQWSGQDSTTNFEYDAAGQLTRVTDHYGNYIKYGYDPEGNQKSQEIHDSLGTLRQSLSSTFDRFNRLDLSQRNFSTENNDFDPDGTMDQSSDGKNTVTDYSYDDLNRLITTIEDFGNLDITTEYIYDLDDRLVKVNDPENLDTTYSYDDLGNLLSVTSPDTGTTNYVYDDAGNMTSKTDANGIIIGYIYDELNRLKNINYPNDTDVVYNYDDTINSTNGVGRLTSVTDAAGSVVYDYDQNGNVTSKTRTQDTLSFATSYDYNIRDELTKITYPSGREVNYIKNRLGQATEVTTTFGGSTEIVANNITYLPYGPQNSLTFGNGINQIKTYDTDYRLTDIADGGILISDMNLDANGNVDDRTNTFSYSFCDGNICGDLVSLDFNDFQYDNLNRITQDFSPTSSYTEDFTYDDVGNRKTRTYNGSLKNYFYGANDHQLEQIANGTVSTFTHDNVGNTKTTTDYTYFYDDINRISSVEDSGQSLIASYVYDSHNLRTKKIAADTYYYQYDLEGQLIAEFDQSGNTIREYIYLNGMPIALVSSPNTVTQALFQDDCTGADGTIIDDQADGFWKGKNPTSDISATIQSNQAEVNPNEWIQTNTIFKDEAGSTLNVSYSMESTGKSNLRKLGTSKRGIQVHFKPDDNQAIVKLGTSNNSADSTTINFVNSGVQSINVDIAISEGIASVNITDSLGQTYTVGPVNHPELSTGDEYKLRLQTLKISGTHVPSTVDAIDIAAQSIATIQPSNLYFYHVDQLGTPKLMTRSDQTVAWSANYSAFGEATVSVEDVTNHIRFPGQYYDQETGLHYNWNRYYEPAIGRYITSDPIGLTHSYDSPLLKQSLLIGLLNMPDNANSIYPLNHLYNYTDQNPMTRIDKEGLAWGWVFKGLRWVWKQISKKKPKNKDKPDDFICPPERAKNCEAAFWRCMADTSVSESLCIKSLTECKTTPFATIFPHGEIVR